MPEPLSRVVSARAKSGRRAGRWCATVAAFLLQGASMVFIGVAQQSRLIEAANRYLGSSGEAILRAAALEMYGVPLDQLGYLQVPPILKRIEQEVGPQVGHEAATTLAAALDQLGHEPGAGVGDRLAEAASRRLGPAAEPFLANVCARLGLALATLERTDLPRLAEGIRHDAALLLGEEAAQLLASAVLEPAAARPAGLAARVVALASEHAGPDGEALVRGLCRARLEADLDALDLDGIRLLARVVESDAPAPIGAARLAAFVAEAQQALVSNAEALRARIVQLATRAVGPAGPEIVHEACLRHGVPFESVDYEHLMWLSEALRSEAAGLAGRKTADGLAHELRALLTGKM